MAVPNLSPFWGPQTSNLNFCEEDYSITRYIAEFINTLTNLTYLIYGIYGLYNLRSKPNAAARSIPYWGLIGVGVCSAAYHMTLKYHTQMSDELSMHMATTPLVHRVMTFGKSERYTRTTGIILSVIFVVVIVVHASMDEFLLHASAFAGSIHIIRTRTFPLIKTRISDPAKRKQLLGMARFAAFSFGLAYAVWLIDRFCCPQLTQFRQFVGLPLGFLTELHGWWHILTGMGAYVFMNVVDYITNQDLRDDPVETVAWPGAWAAQSFFGGRDLPTSVKTK